jgi:hypothetical protein
MLCCDAILVDECSEPFTNTRVGGREFEQCDQDDIEPTGRFYAGCGDGIENAQEQAVLTPEGAIQAASV